MSLLQCPVCSRPDLPPGTASCPACGTDLRPLWRVRRLAETLDRPAAGRLRGRWLLLVTALVALLGVLGGYLLGTLWTRHQATLHETQLLRHLEAGFADYRQEHTWDRRGVAALRLERNRLRAALESSRGDAGDPWRGLYGLDGLVAAGGARALRLELSESLFVPGTADLTAEGTRTLADLVERCARLPGKPRISVRPPPPGDGAEFDGDAWEQWQRAWTVERQLRHAAMARGTVTVGEAVRRRPSATGHPARLGVLVEVRGMP